MSERDLKNMRSLDEAAEKAAGFVSFLDEKDIRYDIRKINKYCKDKGIEPVDLTIRELNSFIIKSPN